ncbi:hypothetical protein FRB95_009811 [Tulasnella sp. JGI-2019a]|nr:hypothetical protein FRB95_009811 [Tulasnella sp. JGI-2019a]
MPPPPPLGDEAPRQTHVLRPHHVAILSVFVLVLRDPPSPAFNLHVWRVLAKEISELYPPKSFEELVRVVSSGRGDIPDEGSKMGRGLRNVPKHLMTHDGMSQFFTDVIAFVPERELDGSQPSPSSAHSVERRSFFGLFIRRCYLSFFKLSWRGTMRLIQDYKDWTDGKEGAGYSLQDTDRDGGLLLLPTQSDEQQYAQSGPYEEYEKAAKQGDAQAATENLRKFFDQRFSDSVESGLTQHALLHLARLHYSQGSLTAAANALGEALKVARIANDSITVLHCNNLMKRLSPALESNRVGKLPTIQPNTSALEVLWDVKKMIEVGESVRAGFTKLYQSMGIADASYADPHESLWARHSCQATLWVFAGVESLAQTHENFVIAFTEPGDDEARFTSLLMRARRLLRQGNFGGALLVLLNPETWAGLNLRQHGVWASEVWKTLRDAVQRRRQDTLMRSFLQPRRPAEPNNMQMQSTHTPFPKMLPAQRSEIIAKSLIEGKEYSEAVPIVLDALWNSEFVGSWAYHRVAVAQLAEISVEFGMAGKGRRMIEGILPQVLNGDNVEIRAYACYTLARCIIAESWSQDDPNVPPPPARQNKALEAALPFLHVAEQDYTTMEMYQERLNVIYMLSVVYHNLALGHQAIADGEGRGGDGLVGIVVKQMHKERDRMAEMYHEVDKVRKEVGGMEVDQELSTLWDLVVKASAVVGAQL